MWKGAIELLCCQRPRTNFTKARDRGLAAETRSEKPENPDSFVFGRSSALADEASELLVRVMSADLGALHSTFGLGLDLFVVVHLEEDGKEHLLGRSSTIWMCSKRPCWEFSCPTRSLADPERGMLHFEVRCESFAGWGESWCFGSTSASIQSFREASRSQLSLKSGVEFKGTLHVEVRTPKGPEAVCADRQEVLNRNAFRSDSKSNSLVSQGSTTPEQVLRLPDAYSTASESEEDEATSKVATAMLRHWRQSESFTQAKQVQELAARLQISAKKYEAGKFYSGAKAKDRFFVIIGQEAFLGGLNLQGAAHGLASSLELAWFESKVAYTERQAPLGSVPLHQVRGCSTGAPPSRSGNLDDAARGQMVVVSTLGPSGPRQLEVMCESKNVADNWSRDLQELVSLVKS